MPKQKILVLSVSAGAGHVRAAQALEAWAKEHRLADLVHVDMMTMVPKLFKKLYADSYIQMARKLPALWGYLYDKSDQERADELTAKIRLLIERLNTVKFSGLLEQENPDQVICTHFLPAELLSRLIRKKQWSKPVWVAVTDFDIHHFWVHRYMSGYFAASEEVAFRMADRGVESQKIHVTGIPVAPAFCQELSREQCAAELSIDPRTPTVLMMSGGEGLGGIETLADRLLASGEGFQVVTLAGRNAQLLGALKKVAAKHPQRMLPMPFTTTIERVMTCADLAVTKPGGLTTSECLALGLPMLVVSPIPGQEERNADYLLENGAALKAVDAAGVIYRIRRLIAAPRELQRLQRHAKRLGRPRAAADILKIVLAQNPL